MPPRFNKHFVANAELQRIVLGGNTESDVYVEATNLLKAHTLSELDALAERFYGQTGDSLEIAERAAEVLGDRAQRCMCYAINKRVLKQVVIQAARKYFRNTISAYQTDFEQDVDDGRELEDPGANARLLERTLIDLIVLSRRSWIYLSLAGHRGIARGWLGQFAKLYLDNGNQPTVTRAKDAFTDAARQLTDAVEKCTVGDLLDQSSLGTLMKNLSTHIQQELENNGFQEPDGFREALATRGLELIRDGRPDGVYASPNYALFARALDDLCNKTEGQGLQRAADAVAAVIASGEAYDAMDTARLTPWLESLDKSHQNELEVENVLTGIQNLAANMIDVVPPNPAEKPKTCPRHDRFVDRVARAIQNQEYQDPEWTTFLNLWQCESRQELLFQLRHDPAPMPSLLFTDRPELLTDVREILDDWRNTPDHSTRPAELIFQLKPPEDELEACFDLVDEWTIPDIKPPETWDLGENSRDPILASVALAAIDCLNDYLSEAGRDAD